MKSFSLITFFLASLLPVTALSTEDLNSSNDENISTADNYLDEIKAACQQEAAGMDDADEYIKHCIDEMKKSF